MAKALANIGARIALVARDEKRLESVRDAINAHGSTAAAFTGDVTQENDVAAVARCHGEVGPPQILINNAGINIRKPLVDFSLAEFRNVIGA